VSYNTSAVKIYNAASSLVHKENKKNTFNSTFEKRSSLLIAGVVVVNSKVIGFGPGHTD
jgi:hypothetical protein